MTAKRASIKEVILCNENEKDISRIKESYLKGLKFHCVSEMSQVIERARTHKAKSKNAKKLV